MEGEEEGGDAAGDDEAMWKVDAVVKHRAKNGSRVTLFSA